MTTNPWSYETLRARFEAGVLTLAVDRAARRNAIDLQVIGELHELLAASAADEAVRVLIVTGTGDRVFISGADIRDLRARRRPEALHGLNNRLFNAVEQHPKPIIAAINGICLGGGCELAMACDIRLAAASARLGFPEVGLGIMPAAGGTQRLPRLVGYGKAKELILTGDIIDAEEACRIGLVNRVVPDAELAGAARELADRILRRAPLAVELAKWSLNLAGEVPRGAGLELESVAQAMLFESADKEEGMTAFLEKRQPHFKRR